MVVEVTKSNLGHYSEARFGQDFNFRFNRNIPCQSFARILSCNVEFQGLVASLMLDKLL